MTSICMHDCVSRAHSIITNIQYIKSDPNLTVYLQDYRRVME